MTTEKVADWCEETEGFAICGTRMVEHSRRSMDVKWCFTCRKRHEFWWVVMAPDGMSYYGPHVEIQGARDGCRDLFPGWTREWGED
jgi:hypothetical protein